MIGKRFFMPCIVAVAIAAPCFGAVKPFDGAEWISVESDSLPLYPDYLSGFRLGFRLDMTPGNSASILFGVDDPRLMDADKNIYGLASRPGESYMRLGIEGDSIKL